MRRIVRLSCSSPLRAFGLSLAFAVLLLRVLVPAGWMVSATPGDAFEIVICTADGAVTMTGDLTDEDTPKDSKSGECLFSAVSAAAVPAVACPAPTPPVVAGAVAVFAAALVPGRGLAAPPPPATGPPLLA
jgi:hypothetical protein